MEWPSATTFLSMSELHTAETVRGSVSEAYPCTSAHHWQATHCLLSGTIYSLLTCFLSSCVQSSMLHGSETWPVRKENEVALQRAEMRMVRWMCNVKVKDRVSSKELT